MERRLFDAIHANGAMPYDMVISRAATLWGIPPWEVLNQAAHDVVYWASLYDTIEYIKSLEGADKAVYECQLFYEE